MLVTQLVIGQAKIWTETLLTQKLTPSHYALLLPRSCCRGSVQCITHSFVHSFIYPASSYLFNTLLCDKSCAWYGQTIWLSCISPNFPKWLGGAASQDKELCKTIRVIRVCNYQQVRDSLTPVGVFLIKVKNSKVKMRLNAPCPLRSIGIATMPLWHPPPSRRWVLKLTGI